MLSLPRTLTLPELSEQWAQLEPALRAEAAQVRAAAGDMVRLDASAVDAFDTAALALLMASQRCCQALGLTLRITDAPAALRRLAHAYGVIGLLPLDDDLPK